jgi:polysaccharide biosynthesis/export protein ExoF
MRRIIALTGLLFCLALKSAVAQTAYLLEPGDVLQVWIAQEQDHNLQIAIGPDGWTSFPLAGHIKGEGLTVSALEAALLERIKPYFKETPNLTLMLQPRTQHQPLIYMTGDVVTPGEYPYRQNMTVLHGVSVAGGLYRTAMLPADQDRSVVVQREIELSETRLKQLKVLILRLQAELAGQSTIESAELAPTDPLLVEEQRLLDANMKAAERQDAAQRQAKELASRNIKALSEQIETVATRLRLARIQLDRITGLIAKGAAGGAMQTVQEGVIAELEGQNSEMKSEIVAAERVRISEDAAFEITRHERKTRLLLEIQTAQRELQERQASLADSKRILTIYREAVVENQQTTDQTITYRILRIVDGQAKEFDVREVSTLRPGDLVRVIFSDPARRRTASVVDVRPENLNLSRNRSATSQTNRISGVSQ